MIPAALTNDETERLEALRRLSILDTLPEDIYDCIVELASDGCDAPISLVSFVDAHRQWFKAKIGLEAAETPREQSFCAHAILEPGSVFEVKDALQDERFCDNPLVTGDPAIRFYAGAPIVTKDGRALGTVCVIDTVPRALNGLQQRMLRSLARQTAILLEQHERSREVSTLARRLDAMALDADQKRIGSDRLFDLILKSGDFGFWELDLSNGQMSANERERQMLGYGHSASLKDLQWRSLIHPDDAEVLAAAVSHHLAPGAGESAYEYQHRMRHADGSWLWVNDRSIVVARDEVGQPTRVIGTHQDITERIQVADELSRATILLQRTNEMAKVGGWEFDIDSKRLVWSDEVYRIHDLNPLSEPSVETALDFYPEEARSVISDAMQRALEDGTSWDLELPLRSARGRHLWVRAQGRPESVNGRVVRLSGAFQDITDRKNIEIELLRMNERLSELSQTDALTQIPNRRSFDLALATEWRRHLRTQSELSLLLIDVDHFKLYNDHYGHLAGDQCLHRIAACLDQSTERAGELLARYGGEEFVLLIPAGRSHALAMAEKCLHAVTELTLEHLGLGPGRDVTVSIGVATAVPDAKDIERSLIDAADKALYRAKRGGRARISL